MHPQSTGKSITLQPRDILWLEKLQEHGLLPSSFLLQYCRDTHKSEKRSQERLTDLFNENHTPDRGSYLTRPPQQFRTLDSRYNQLVYDLTKPSRAALSAAELAYDDGNSKKGPWVHQLMVSCITASIELACMARSDANFIAGSQILARAKTDLRCDVEVFDPSSKKRCTKTLIPDALFGLEYLTDEGSSYRFFAVEADRATEPATSANFYRKSVAKNLLQYQAYIEGEVYRDHLKLTAPMMVLNVTTSAVRRAKMLDVTARLFPAGNSYMLFQHWEDFGEVFTPPSPRPDLLDGLWQRARMENFCIQQR